MDSYTTFARVYDNFMDNIPYNQWSEYIISLLEEHNIINGLLLDLGCGTGTLTELMASKGFEMIGVDNSYEMLDIAKEKSVFSNSDILYLLQDMREFELYGTVSAIISVCDSINYITDSDNLLDVFKLANNYLDPNGIFIFDFNTLHHYKDILADNTFAEDRDDISFIWDNYYDNDSHINEYSLSLFIKEDNNIYRKFVEEHYQRGYTIDEIIILIKESGLELLEVYDAFTRAPATKDSTRVYVIAREHGKAL